MLSAVKLTPYYEFVGQYMYTSILTNDSLHLYDYISTYQNLQFNIFSSPNEYLFSIFLIQVATVSSETDKPQSGVVREPPFRKQRSGHGVTLPQVPSFLGGTADWFKVIDQNQNG